MKVFWITIFAIFVFTIGYTGLALWVMLPYDISHPQERAGWAWIPFILGIFLVGAPALIFWVNYFKKLFSIN